MMIGAIIFVTVVHSVAGTNDMRAVERVALKSFVYFEAITIVALIFGLVAAELWRPGVGMNTDAGAIDTAAIKTSVATAHDQPIGGDLLHIIPSAFPGALTDREVLQVLSISVLGIAVSFPASARSRWSTASRAPRAGDA